MTSARPPLRLCAVLCAALAACSSGPTPDALFLGRVWTGDSTLPWAQAGAVRGDSILALGDSATLLRSATGATRIFRGAFVMPGFQDDHTHFFGWGQTLAA